MTAYSDTSVPVARSQEAIRQILRKANVRGIQFAEDWNDHKINVRFALLVAGNFHTVSVTIQIPDPPQKKILGLRLQTGQVSLSGIGLSSKMAILRRG